MKLTEEQNNWRSLFEYRDGELMQKHKHADQFDVFQKIGLLHQTEVDSYEP